jgi:hypothetical protein
MKNMITNIIILNYAYLKTLALSFSYLTKTFISSYINISKALLFIGYSFREYSYGGLREFLLGGFKER